MEYRVTNEYGELVGGARTLDGAVEVAAIYSNRYNGIVRITKGIVHYNEFGLVILDNLKREF